MIITSNNYKITVIILSIIYKLYKSNQQVTKDIYISSRNLRDYTCYKNKYIFKDIVQYIINIL